MPSGLRVLGVDPGTINMGYGVLDDTPTGPEMVACGVLKASQARPVEQRLHTLYLGLLDLMQRYDPGEVAVEEPFVHKSARSSILIGQANAVALLAASGRGAAVFHYSPRQVKMAVTGHGGSDKEQVREMVRLQLDLDSFPDSLDASDAVAVALCHLQESAQARLLAESAQG